MARRLQAATEGVVEMDSRLERLTNQMDELEESRIAILPEANKRLMVYVPPGPCNQPGVQRVRAVYGVSRAHSLAARHVPHRDGEAPFFCSGLDLQSYRSRLLGWESTIFLIRLRFAVTTVSTVGMGKHLSLVDSWICSHNYQGC